MRMADVYNKVNNDEAYSFLETNKHLAENIILLTMGGSIAYGTNVETSDIDIRGCAVNTPKEILTGKDWGTVTDEATDTVIYSFNKLIGLLSDCNPNTIEMLGCKPEHYIKVTRAGRMLLDNVDLFLSQKAAYSFGGYANAQLRRLENLSNREKGQSDQERHILGTLQHLKEGFDEKYGIPMDSLNLYIDKAVNEDMDTEIFMDVVLHHYPVRDYKEMWAELNNVIKSYKQIGCRNSKAIEHKKLNKHMMHLIRLYMMGIDILQGNGIRTYRDGAGEHELLMSIRNGAYTLDNLMPTKEFYELVDDFSRRFEEAKETTKLPKTPDYEAISNLVYDVNSFVVSNS